MKIRARPARRRATLVALCGLLALGACASTAEPTFREDLSGTCWTLRTLDGKPVLAHARPTLCFDENGALSGSTGCNQYNATAQYQGDSISLGPVTTTRKACEEEVMEQERLFLTRLERARRWLLADKTLLVYGDTPPALRFDREDAR